MCVFDRQVPHVRDPQAAECQVYHHRGQGQQAQLGAGLHVVSTTTNRNSCGSLLSLISDTGDM